ncbi:MAG: hypothetical protein FWE06_01080 [Oscillospiraceae bacterium]|nr:hypothetical protein [Oscillospiraceae bacterium]
MSDKNLSGIEQREERRRSSIVASIAGVDKKSLDESTTMSAGAVVVKRKGEIRDRRKQFVLKPSTHDMAEAKCKKLGISMNEAINQLLENWINSD